MAHTCIDVRDAVVREIKLDGANSFESSRLDFGNSVGIQINSGMANRIRHWSESNNAKGILNCRFPRLKEADAIYAHGQNCMKMTHSIYKHNQCFGSGSGSGNGTLWVEAEAEAIFEN